MNWKKIRKSFFPDKDPLWYQSATIYEVHVRAFHDSDPDGPWGIFAG
jgi:pullulanase/glycogen debranching enzyme